MIRRYLEDSMPNPDGSREKPGLFICRNNKYWLEFVPTAPRDTKDPDVTPEKYEDHMVDMTRYRLSWAAPTMWRAAF